MRADPKGTGFFVQWSLGILSSLCVAAIIALGRTVMEHEVAIAVLRENCLKEKKPSALAAPPEKHQSILGSFGFGGARKPSNEGGSHGPVARPVH